MPRPVRVVFVTSVFEGVETGPGTFARYLWRAFADDPDLEFHLVTPTVTTTHARLHASGYRPGSLALYRQLQVAARRLVAQAPGFTVVHGNSTFSMSRFVGYPGPWLVQVNDYYTASFPQHALITARQQGLRRAAALAWRHLRERQVLRNATAAIANSAHTANVVRFAYGLAEDRIRVVYKAVDTTHFRRPESLPEDPFIGTPREARLLFVGTDWRTKGLDVLLESLAKLGDNWPNLSVNVAGPTTGDAELRAAIARRGLMPRVRLHGRVTADVVARMLWHSDVFVLPSRAEGLGVAVLEAMAAGVPVVATSVGGLPEIIRSNAEGRLVPPEDPTALAREIDGLLRNHALRKALGSAGVRRASEFSVDRMTAEIKTLYRGLEATRPQQCR